MLGEDGQALSGSSSSSLLHHNEFDNVDSELAVGSAHMKRIETLVRKKKCISCSLFGFLSSLLVAIGLPLVVEQGIRDGVKGDVLIDSPTADGFAQFQERAHDGNDYIEFYFFNITNPHQVLNGAKPALEEIGPFCYNSYQVRGDFVWTKEKDTLAYREHTYYAFNKERTVVRTGGKFDNDKVPITTLNLLFNGMRALVGTALWHVACDTLLWKNDFDRLFTTRTPVEMANGYTEELKLFGGLIKIPIPFPGLMPNETKKHDPNWQKKTTMLVGEKDLDDVYEIVSWRGMEEVEISCPWGQNPLADCSLDKYPCCFFSSREREAMYADIMAGNGSFSSPPAHGIFGHRKVPVWGTDKDPTVWDSNANLVHGHNGEQFAPYMDSSDDLIIFNDIAWRALRFHNYDNEEVEFKGIKMLRYTPLKTTFMNSTEHPSNARYYQHGPRGLFVNLSMTQQGAELFASLPHFLEGDDSLIQGVTGLAPDHDKHRMQIDVEPTLGQTMVEHVRAQVNGRLTRGEHWGFDNWFPHVIDGTYVPIAWFDMISEITDSGADEFKQIYTARDVQKGAVIFGSVTAVLCSLPLLYVLSIKLRSRNSAKPGTGQDQYDESLLGQDLN